MQSGTSFSITKTVVYWIIALACFAGCLWMFVHFLPRALTPMLLLLGAIVLPVGALLLTAPLLPSDKTGSTIFGCALVGSGLCIYFSKLPFDGVVAFSMILVIMTAAALLASRYITHLLINVLRRCLGHETEPLHDLLGGDYGEQIPSSNSPEYYYYMHFGEGAKKYQRWNER